jgi:NTE family protein
MTDISKFIAAAAESVAIARKLKDQKKEFSDMVDGAGNQYVDLVMEGGGVLGIALTGYTYVLEQAGIRFLGVGGTSAGSINALMIAALDIPSQPKSEKLLATLAEMPMDEFIDGDSDARDFSHALLDKARMTKLLFKAAQVMDNLKDDLGLNPGDRFRKWLSGELAKAGIRTNAELRARLHTKPQGLRNRNGGDLTEAECRGVLAMVAADVTTETKVEFPKMAKLYWEDPDSVDPAYFARASMSIPLFFHPFRVKCPQSAEIKTAWETLASYEGKLPEYAYFIDGGIMSNFPINLFHEPYKVPAAPTFGAKIGVDRAEPTEITSPQQLIGAMFDAARHTLDYDFIVQNPDYRHLVAMIKTGDHNWLNFALSDADKVDLFQRGAIKAAEFLQGFDWAAYKKIRGDLRDAFLKGRGPSGN